MTTRATTRRKSRAKKRVKETIVTQVKNFVLSPQGFPFVLSLTVICILYVLFRMKGVEQDYQHNKLMKKIETAVVEGKELKAHKARLLSVKNLRKYASKFKMREPKQSQVIIVP